MSLWKRSEPRRGLQGRATAGGRRACVMDLIAASPGGRPRCCSGKRMWSVGLLRWRAECGAAEHKRTCRQKLIDGLQKAIGIAITDTWQLTMSPENKRGIGAVRDGRKKWCRHPFAPRKKTGLGRGQQGNFCRRSKADRMLHNSLCAGIRMRHAKIVRIDVRKARRCRGVVARYGSGSARMVQAY